MRILAAQINPTIGDLKGNTQKVIQAIERGRKQDIDLIVFPELTLTGYPPDDLILFPHFMSAVEQHLEQIIQATQEIAVIVGLPRYSSIQTGKSLYNSAAFIQDQKLIDFADKILLPTYDVFDERRYFEPGERVKRWEIKNNKIAVTICEDLWQHSGLLQGAGYSHDPVLDLIKEPLSCLINLSASPYHFNKFHSRLKVCSKTARTLNCPVILCNQVGANDSLIFDGYSMHVNPNGLLQYAKGFVEDDLIVDLSKPLLPVEIRTHPLEDLGQALILGLRDYFEKSNFKQACLGLSGGIDSAVVACLAAQALGPENVLGVSMPSRYTSSESTHDAALLAERLGIQYQEISIENSFESYLTTLSKPFEGREEDYTEENLQARIRGMLLMAFSNKFNYLVLNTSNKSEIAIGYSTLYGDLCGSLSILGDVTKQQVYALAQWINKDKEIIPLYTLERPPSAELRPNQKDSDSLPDYAVIDQVVQSYVEEHQSPQWIAEQFNYPIALVQQLVKRIHLNEYKRRQAPPCLRVSSKAFSIGRKFPIVQKWI